MTFVLFQLLLRQREHLFTHQRRHRDLDPLRAGTLMTTNVATRQGFPLTERARDTLPGPLFGLAIARTFPDTRDCAACPKRWIVPNGLYPCVSRSGAHSIN